MTRLKEDLYTCKGGKRRGLRGRELGAEGHVRWVEVTRSVKGS